MESPPSYNEVYKVATTSSTVVVYIQGRVSSGLGFGVCVAANLSGFMVFMLGKQYYRYVKPKESPFASIARAVGAAIMKRNAARSNCYFYETAELSRLNCGPTTDFSEALHYPGQVALYYKEFPESLRNTATAMISLIVGIAFYSSAVVIGLIGRDADWLPDDINEGRADYVYWIMSGIGIA
ncbi:hypothetical protein AgCh_039822 [Apium graveolens]